MNSLVGKITLLCISICLFTGIVFSVQSYLHSRDLLVKSEIRKDENAINLFGKSIISKIEELKRDVEFLSMTPPIRGILRASKNGGIDPLDRSSIKNWKDRLAIIFKEMLHAKEKYIQIRYVSFKTGKEMVRVDRIGTRVARTPEKNLQDKSKETYFRDLVNVFPGKIYLSPFSLNREQGKVVRPLQMVIRAAVPIHDKIGDPFGFVIVNIDYTGIFKGLDSIAGANRRYYILDDGNRMLVDSGREVDTFLETEEQSPVELEAVKPVLANFKSEKNTSIKKIREDGKMFLLNRLRYNEIDPSQYLDFVLSVPVSVLLSSIQGGLTRSGLLLLFTLLLTVIVSGIFLRSFIEPIRKLMKVAQRIRAGENVGAIDLKLVGKDEIGTLINTFVGLSRDLIQKRSLLEVQKNALDSAAIVAETDLSGKITYINEKFIEISQYSREELMGQNHRILNSKYHPKEFFVDLWKTISRGQIWRGEIKNRAKDGTYYWVATTIYPVTNETGKLFKYVSIRFDITDRKLFEERLTLATKHAQQAMLAKSEFLANMSHEIRTPLNAVIGLADVLFDTPLNNEQKEYLTSLRDSGESLMSIINDVLDLSKIESGHMEIQQVEFDLEDLTKQVCEILGVGARKKGLEVALDFDPEVPTKVVGDPIRLRQVLVNLVGNAIKFTEKGFVLLEVALVEPLKEQSALIEIRIKDTGIGIAKENIERVFENFTQADGSITRQFGGTGLGLNIVKKLVEKMNGRISLESELGKGSLFRVDIPFRCGAASNEEGNEFTLEGKRVLVVDDFSVNRMILRRVLEQWGAYVEEADSGESAIQKISDQAHSKPYDLIFLDGRMKDFSGLDVLAKIRKKNISYSSHYVMLTSDPTTGDREKAKQLGIHWFLAKPIRKQDLRDVIAQIFHHPFGQSLLVVDDDLDLLQSLKSLLMPLGYDVRSAATYEEALNVLGTKAADFLISDFRLPDKSGVSLIREAKSQNPGLKCILMSGFMSKELKDTVADLEVAFLEKPFASEQLLRILDPEFSSNRPIQIDETAVAEKKGFRILVAEDSVKNQKLLEIYI